MINFTITQGTCNGNMAEGSLRVDVNVSVRPQGETELGTRTEIKNLNSIRHVMKAIEYEANRHVDIIESNGVIKVRCWRCVISIHPLTTCESPPTFQQKETLTFDAQSGKTQSLRSKETDIDYRFFPDPDLPILKVSPEDVQRIRESLPEMPEDQLVRLQEQYRLDSWDANVS